MPLPVDTTRHTLTPKNGHSFSLDELAVLNLSVGFPREEVARATGIAYAESRGDPLVTSKNPDGNPNVGLFQIDTATAAGIGRTGNLKDPVYNARTAYLLWKHGGGGTKGWGIWQTFTNGAYKQYMDQVPGIFGPHLTGATNPDPFGSGGAIDKTGKAIGGGIGSVGDFLGKLAVIFTGGFWLRVLMGLGGLVLVILGIIMAARGVTVRAAAGIVKGRFA